MMFCNDKVVSSLEAYLLGFIYADGCVTSMRVNSYNESIYYALSIALSMKDEDFLHDIASIFNKDLCKSYKLARCEKTNSVKLSVCNKDLVMNLIRLGISPNKTYQDSSFVFDNVPDNFKIDFIRGFFDGDGTTGVTTNEGKPFVGFVTLNKSLANSLFNYLRKNTGYFGLHIDRSRYYRIYTSGINAVISFRDLIYYDDCFCMKRKYDKIFSFERPIKHNYVCIYRYHNKYKCNYRGKYIGLYYTIKDAVNAYNILASVDGRKSQEYVGEVL